MSQKKKTTAQSKRPRKAPSNQTGGTAGVVQAHGIAADDALLLHAVDTAGHRRTGQVDLFGDFLDRHAGVAHHKLDDFAV